MRYCTNCGHQLGIGRYCTNCGARIATVTVTAAPPPVTEPVTEPVAGSAPPRPRYPLYADTVPRPPVAPPPAPTVDDERRSRPVLPWLAGLLVLALVTVTGGLLLVLGSSDGDRNGSGSGADRRDPAANTDDGPSGEIEPAGVVVPATAPTSVDESGTPVTFEAANMVDAEPRTCWRMAGDGSGSTVVLRFDEPVTVTDVGLVNGYAKSDPPHDWYVGNRRITAVAWVFDDGTEISQNLVADRDLQTVAVDAVETTEIELRILEVSEPGHGPDRRDYTAISDVAIRGR